MSGIFLPSTLGRIAIKGFAFPRHVQRMQQAAMELVYNPAFNRLVVEIPVRHGKSFFWSYLFPTWHVLKFPDKNILIVSYGDDFAGEWSAKIRDIVSVWGPELCGVNIDKSTRAKSHFRLAAPHTGEVRGIGIFGAQSGKGHHFISADDLVKEFSDIATEEARDKLFDQFHGELLSRLEPGGKIVIVMSRRHPDDLSGRLLATNEDLPPADQWHSLKFPALDEGGRALWPARYPARKLRAIRRDHELAGTAWQWHSLYQQDPTAAAEFCEWPASYWTDIMYTLSHEIPTTRKRLVALDASMGTDRKPGNFSALLYGLVDAQGTLWIEEPMMLREPAEIVVHRALGTLKLGIDAIAVESGKGQEWIARDLRQKLAGRAPLVWYENEEPRELRIRRELSSLLAAGKIKIRETPGGKILAQQLRDFPLASYQDGPAALALLCQLSQYMARPAAPGGDVRIETS